MPVSDQTCPRHSDDDGFVTLTGRARAARGVKSRHGSALLSPPSFSARDHPARDLALSPLYAELPRRGGTAPERGLDISYETVRRWVLKFGPTIARRLRQRRPRPSDRWHLDEMVIRIAGVRMYLWRSVDHEGEVLDMLVQRRRDTRAALRLMRKLLKKQGFPPKFWSPTSCAPTRRRSGN